MRPKKPETTRSGDLFRARLEQIINLKHELAQLAGQIDWDFIDGEIAPLYSDQGRPGIEARFAIGLLLLKHIYGLSDEGVCERWVYDPYFQYFKRDDVGRQRCLVVDRCWPRARHARLSEIPSSVVT
jgi:IS5 family transposase